MNRQLHTALRWLVIATAFSIALLGQALPAQAVAPTVVNVTSPDASGVYGINDTFTITVQFSQVVTVIGSPTLSMNYATGQNSNASYQSGSGTNTLSFTFNTPNGTTTANLDYSSTNALSTAGGSIRNSSAADASLTLPAPGAPGSLSSNKQFQFEYFGTPTRGLTTPDDSSQVNMAWSQSLGRPVSSIGNSIVSLSLAMDTRTVILDTGALVYNLQIYSNYIYWTSGNTLYRTSITSPSKTALYTHSSLIAGFSRTASNWAFVDIDRNLYRLSADGNYTPTLVTTLSSTIVDYPIIPFNFMYTSFNPGKVLWEPLFTPNIYEIDISNGSSTIYANYSKCGSQTRSFFRLDDGSEFIPIYGQQKIAHRWPDGHITCSAVVGGITRIGASTSDGTKLYSGVADQGTADLKFMRLIPSNTTWQIASTYDPSSPQPATLQTPAFSNSALSAMKGVTTSIRVVASTAGKVTFWANGKRIGGCINLATVTLVATCNWKPAVQGSVKIFATITPTLESFLPGSSPLLWTSVVRRTTTR
jgi:hypothetical protein